MASFWDDDRQPVPTIIALLLIGAAVVATGWLVRDFGARSFPADHGLVSGAPDWLRCAAETIERHPSPFTTGGFRITATDGRSAVVEGTFRTIDITLVEGWLTYRWGRGSRLTGLDCPEVGLASAEQRRQDAEAAESARPCSERYGVRVEPVDQTVNIGVAADPPTIERCGYRGVLQIRLVDDLGQEVMAWSGEESPERSETDWRIANWCHAITTLVMVSWIGGETAEPFGPAPACVDPASAPFVSPP
ncbi:MAG: hypothetical protein WEE36_11345 [Acidimicrobiia bacterium]